MSKENAERNTGPPGYPATVEGCLRGLRELGISQTDLSVLIGYSLGRVHAVLRGKAKSPAVVAAMARILNRVAELRRELGIETRPDPLTTDVVSMAGLAHELGLTRQRLHALWFEGRMPPWFKPVPRMRGAWAIPRSQVPKIRAWWKANRRRTGRPTKAWAP